MLPTNSCMWIISASHYLTFFLTFSCLIIFWLLHCQFPHDHVFLLRGMHFVLTVKLLTDHSDLQVCFILSLLLRYDISGLGITKISTILFSPNSNLYLPRIVGCSLLGLLEFFSVGIQLRDQLWTWREFWTQIFFFFFLEFLFGVLCCLRTPSPKSYLPGKPQSLASSCQQEPFLFALTVFLLWGLPLGEPGRTQGSLSSLLLSRTRAML